MRAGGVALLDASAIDKRITSVVLEIRWRAFA
jgi:hypothetical protein